MSIQVAEGRFVQFRYEPDYLTGKSRHLRVDGEISFRLPWIRKCVRSEIVLDGGNVVRWRDTVILTEKAFDENPEWERRRLIAELESVLEVDRIVLIPPEPGDVTGHADGVVRFVDGGTVLVNDYRRVDRDYRRALLRRLKAAGLVVRELPYRPVPGSSEGMPSAIGNYINFLQVRGLFLLPTYEFPEDGDARGILARSFPVSSVVTLDCRELASDGGVLNCASWTTKTVLRVRRVFPSVTVRSEWLASPRPSAAWVPLRMSFVEICPETID